jgi:hypothetical protein
MRMLCGVCGRAASAVVAAAQHCYNSRKVRLGHAVNRPHAKSVLGGGAGVHWAMKFWR